VVYGSEQVLNDPEREGPEEQLEGCQGLFDSRSWAKGGRIQLHSEKSNARWNPCYTTAFPGELPARSEAVAP
jgi:hypothetical protein